MAAGTENSPGLDGLAPARRRLQALLNIVRSAGRPGPNGSKRHTGLPQAKVVVYCQLATLLGLAEKAGITQHGLSVPPGDLRRLLCNAGVLPIVCDGESRILDVGREERYAPDYMREAVLARDGGCIFPGCSVPPEHVEMCHIDGWAEGGSTSVENLAAACTAHHHGFHLALYDLVRDAQGLPSVLFPEYMDPSQVPKRNTYWGQQTQINPTLF